MLCVADCANRFRDRKCYPAPMSLAALHPRSQLGLTGASAPSRCQRALPHALYTNGQPSTVYLMQVLDAALSWLSADRPHSDMSLVLVAGMPNTGKSSLINALKRAAQKQGAWGSGAASRAALGEGGVHARMWWLC